MARARNVMLWGEAYAAVPAGSLPDDDDELAEAAGFGFDVEAFLEAKDEIMSSWVMCSDGRWYHPTVCEVALDGWNRLSDTRRKDALRKADHRAKSRGQAGISSGHDNESGPVTPKNDDVTRDIADVTRDRPENRRDKSHRQTGQDRTGQKDINPQPPAGGERTVSKFQEGFEAYPEAGRQHTEPQKASNAWFTAAITVGTEEVLLEAVKRYAASPGVRGDGARRVPSLQKWLTTGRYKAFLGGSHTPRPCAFAGPAELRAAVVVERGEAFAASYLDPCGWQDIPRAVIGRTGVGADKLRREAGRVFSDAGVLIEDPVRGAA